MRLTRSDVLLAILGIAVAVSIFIAQGPYENWWQYLLPSIPLLLAVLCVGFVRLYKATEGLRRSYSILQRKYDLMTALRGTSQMVVRVLNEQGDIEYEREYRLELLKGCSVETTKQEHVSCQVPISSMPPSADFLESSAEQQSLIPDRLHAETESINGIAHTHYSWFYRLKTPLKTRGDFVGYRYRIKIPKSEADAFTDQGGLLFIECGAIYLTIEATLIAPAGFTIEILECTTIDYDGAKRQLPAELSPSVNAAGEVLSWTPRYAHGLKYLCRYRCVAK